MKSARKNGNEYTVFVCPINKKEAAYISDLSPIDYDKN
jgi:hypothetical protein